MLQDYEHWRNTAPVLIGGPAAGLAKGTEMPADVHAERSLNSSFSELPLRL